MRILAPLDAPAEIGALVEAGADELYGGVQPASWTGRVLSANQRTFAAAQFAGEQVFREAVMEARRLGVPVHLVLNAPLYDPADYPDLLALAERAVQWGTAGLIVGDLGLLLRLQERALPLEITLSTLTAALNRAAFGLLCRLGVQRAVLPRHLTLDEMGSIVDSCSEVLFEAFVLVGRCPNEESLCTFQHVSPGRRWPCEIAYDLRSCAGARLGLDHPLVRWHASWQRADRRFGCGLCGLSRLEASGVKYAKLVGRGGPTAGKVANVRLVDAFRRGLHTREEAREGYAKHFGRPCHPLTCYFPELHPDVSP